MTGQEVEPAATTSPVVADGGSTPPRTVTVNVDGVDVDVDLGYLRSWPGIRQAARMQSPELGEGGRFLAMVEYYERGIANIDDVSAHFGPDASADEVLALLSRAVKEAVPKN